MLGESDMILDIRPCDLVDVVRTYKAENTKKMFGLLLGPSHGYRLPAVGGAVISGNGGDEHESVLVDLCTSCPDTQPSGINLTYFLTIDQSHWMQDMSFLMSLSKIHSCSTACTALTMSH